jgi:hypothetical protein
MRKPGELKQNFLPIFLILGGIACTSLIGLSFLLWKIPTFRAQSVQGLSVKEQYELENATRTSLAQAFGTLSQAIGGTVLLVGVYFTWRNLIATEEKQITERFTRAVEQLGNQQSSTIRLGAIYSLERIAGDSVREHWVVMEILAAFVRENAALSKHENSIEGISEEVQAALTVIKRRDVSKDPKNAFLDLSRTYLKRANLKGEMVKGLAFWKYSSKFSDLSNINFSKSNLSEADFSNAKIAGSNFASANLSYTDFSNASIENATFSSAILTNTRGLPQELISSKIS